MINKYLKILSLSCIVFKSLPNFTEGLECEIILSVFIFVLNIQQELVQP